jgi:hypothetical protein
LFLCFCVVLSCVGRGLCDGSLVKRSPTVCLNAIKILNEEAKARFGM